MHFTYCPHCGYKLIGKEIGDGGLFRSVKSVAFPYGICLLRA